MQKNLIKIAWGFVVVTYVFGYGLLFKEYGSQEFKLSFFIFVFTFGLSALGYLTFRAFIFRRNLLNFLKHLWAGDYETGVKFDLIFKDEIEYIARMMNKAVDRLRIYDALRAERVALNQRASQLIYSSAKEGVILANLDRREFKFNPSAQYVFEIEQELISFEAIEKHEVNRDFFDFFKTVTEREKVPQEKTVTLKLPIKNSQRELLIKIIPLKDQHENTRLAVIFIRRAGGGGRNTFLA